MLENRLHFRLHAAIQTLKSKIAGADDIELYDDEPAAEPQSPSSPVDEGFASLPIAHSNCNTEKKENGPTEAPKASQDPDGNKEATSESGADEEFVDTNEEMGATDKDLAKESTNNNNVQTST